MRSYRSVHNSQRQCSIEYIIVCLWLMDAVVGLCEYARSVAISDAHASTRPYIPINEEWNVHRICNGHLHTNYTWFGVSSPPPPSPRPKIRSMQQIEGEKNVEEKEPETERCSPQQRSYYFIKHYLHFILLNIRSIRTRVTFTWEKKKTRKKRENMLERIWYGLLFFPHFNSLPFFSTTHQYAAYVCNQRKDKTEKSNVRMMTRARTRIK